MLLTSKILRIVYFATLTITMAAGINSCSESSSTSVKAETETVKQPTFSHLAGRYNHDIELTISTSSKNTKIYYTLDGSDPSVNSTLYEDPIIISGDSTQVRVKAWAYSSEMYLLGSVSSFYKIDYTYNDYDFNTDLSLEEFKDKFTGKWIGFTSNEWTSDYNVYFDFRDCGLYSARSISLCDSNECMTSALYWGTDADSFNKTFEIESINCGIGYGNIILYWSSEVVKEATLNNIRFSKDCNNLSFSVNYENSSPLNYVLTRINED
ncbi:MAG: chitobiase/beta-hexosaminidase C-terminal domain-containing protein [Candidatus Delongbacteria bacterium]|nr:chitobiase/beta-hexosaminidase C-terminal domain-containing protein [Candidatus Delongbacteria bacterium]MBN2837091.1 chitobiase/beta-hexosaminidase C-terminal domain-containing protein [Candidatus Delongbacteria bacterium]